MLRVFYIAFLCCAKNTVVLKTFFLFLHFTNICQYSLALSSPLLPLLPRGDATMISLLVVKINFF